MTVTPSQILLRVAAELFNRSDLVKAYLKRIHPGESKEYEQLIHTIRTALTGINKDVLSILRDNENLWKTGISDARQKGLYNLYKILEKFSRWLAEIHELLVLLPRENVLADTVYTLRASFQELYSPKEPSIILGHIYNALEFDLFQLLTEKLPDINRIIPPKTRNIVLQLPICDRDSPSAWAVLAHEMGHAIDSERGFSEKIFHQFKGGLKGKRSETLRCWCEELCADLIAAQALGCAPILALLTWQYCGYFTCITYFDWDEYDTHPTTRWRLKAVFAFLMNKYGSHVDLDFLSKELCFFDAAWTFDIYTDARLQKSEKERVRNEDVDIFKTVIEPMAESLGKEISSLNLPKHDLDPESIKRCLMRLENELPISAQGKPKSYLRNKIAEFRQKPEEGYDTRINEFKTLLDNFKESPLPVPNILVSSHMRRIDLISEFTNTKGPFANPADVLHMREELAKLDKCVIASIRSNGVHSILDKMLHDSAVQSP